jgi:hypothetical protein
MRTTFVAYALLLILGVTYFAVIALQAVAT